MKPFIVNVIRSSFIMTLCCLCACDQAVSQAEKEPVKEEKESVLISEKPDSAAYLAELYDALPIITREDWGAKDPVGEMRPHTLSRITIHHSAVTYRLDYDPIKKIKGLQSFSQSESVLGNGKKKESWADIPYHFVIYANGEIVEGRSLDYAGDTNTEYDPSGHLLINLDGNFEEQEPTEAQLKSLISLSRYCLEKYNLDLDSTAAHKDFAQTLCPGKNLHAKIAEIKEEIGRTGNE